MSLNIQTTSNKTEFLNYFSNPITIPPNSTIALNKVACRIPVWVQKVIRIPTLDAIDRGEDCLRININGVEILLTWTELYTAHTTFGAVDIEENVTADNYFGGNFEYFVNNNVFLNATDLSNTKQKIPFVNVLAKAIDTKLAFYECIPSPVYKNNEIVVNPIDAIEVGGTNYEVLPSADNLIELGFQITYTPSKVFNSTPTIITGAVSFSNLINTTITTDAVNGDTITTNSGTNTTYISACAGNFIIDTNGGYWRFKPSVNNNPGSVICGFSKGGNQNYIAQNYITEFNIGDIHFGIKFNDSTGGAGDHHCYQIIDGTSKNVYNGATNADEPKIYPQTEFLTFNNDNDYFYISVRRALTYEHNNNEYIFQVYIASDENVANSVLVYQSDTFIATPNMPLIPIVCANKNMTDVIKENKYIEMGNDTADLGEYNKTEGIGFCNKFTISALTSKINGSGTPWEASQFLQIVDFWKSWGLSSLVENDFSIEANKGIGTFSKTFRIKVDPFTNIFSFNNVNKPGIFYCVGSPSRAEDNQTLVNLYTYDNATNLFTINNNSNNVITTLPETLNLYINDLSIKNYSGAPPDLEINQSLKEKLLGSVSLVDYQNINENTIWIINYEVFNNLYRPLNNPNPLSINQLNGELSYDIETRRYVIPNIDGLLKIDMNVRSQGIPKLPQNNLLSVGR